MRPGGSAEPPRSGSPAEMVEAALAEGADLDGCMAIARYTTRADLRWARSTLTTNGEASSITLTFLAFVRHGESISTATASRSHPHRHDIRELVAQARHAAQQATPSEDAYEFVLPSGNEPSDWHDVAPGTTGAIFADLSTALGDAFDDAVSRNVELFGYAEHRMETVWLGTSSGVRQRHVQPAGRLEITAKSHGRTRSTWWGHATDDFTDVDLPHAMATMQQRLTWQERSIDIAPGRHACLLTPGAIGDLMVDLWWSLSARSAIEGHSAFSAPGGTTRIGEQLGLRGLNLLSDPHDPVIPATPWLATTGSSDLASVFDNGLPLTATQWVSDGALAHLMAPRGYAARHALPAVVSADTLRLEHSEGRGELDELIHAMDDGLLVTCLWYNRLVDPQTLLLTGLTRDGVYVVRDGEVVGSTTNFRFNDSPVSMLGRFASVGVTERTLPREMGDYAPRVAMPAVVVDGFNLSTVSDAI